MKTKLNTFLIALVACFFLQAHLGATHCDVCDLDFIYDKANGYEYSLPKDVLESFLSGKAFDNQTPYSEEESLRLRDDINQLFQHIIETQPIKEKLAIMTAGAPGAGKTTKMRQDLEQNKAIGKIYAYVCPDDVCLKNQIKTYQAEIEKGDRSREARLAAYNKWRPGANAAAHLILAHLIREKYGFYFGMTGTSSATYKFFDFLKKQGYCIRLIHITAPDDVRWESIKERDKTFIQTTETDVREKGFLLPQRISDTYLSYADVIEFYYRDGVKQDAQLAAVWTRNEEGTQYLGTLQFVNPSLYEKIKAIHNATAESLNRPDLYWESTVEKNSQFLVNE